MCKREMRQIKLYSFFSGCGLLDLGMERAGFNIAMVSEKYERYFPFVVIIDSVSVVGRIQKEMTQNRQMGE